MDRDIGLNGFNIVPGCNNIVHLYRRTVIIICVLLQVYCIVTYFYVNRYQVRNLDSIVDSIDAIGGQNGPPDNIYNIYNRYYIREGVAGAPERSADASLDSASLRKAIYKKEIENLKFLLEILLYG